MITFPDKETRLEIQMPEAVILADGDFPSADVPLQILREARFLCCCDGAAIKALEQGFAPDAIVGDGDSLPIDIKNQLAHLIHHESEQEDNDLTKATRFCMAKGFKRIAYLGATGKREDHTLGNIFLLPHYVRQYGITPEIYTDHGWFCVINGRLEKMDDNPTELIPEEYRRPGEGAKGIEIDLDKGIDAVRAELTKYPVSTRVNLKGTIIVARDIAHAKLKARLDAGEGIPQYFKDHPVLYAGPAKTPEGYPCGSMGPTTANRMDPYVDEFQANGASLVMIAKGNRSQVVTDACQKHGGFYLGTIGGVAAVLSQSSIKSIECVEYPELGMEAVWKITVEDFPAFILVDDKGNDFFKQLKPWPATC